MYCCCCWEGEEEGAGTVGEEETETHLLFVNGSRNWCDAVWVEMERVEVGGGGMMIG